MKKITLIFIIINLFGLSFSNLIIEDINNFLLPSVNKYFSQNEINQKNTFFYPSLKFNSDYDYSNSFDCSVNTGVDITLIDADYFFNNQFDNLNSKIKQISYDDKLKDEILSYLYNYYNYCILRNKIEYIEKYFDSVDFKNLSSEEQLIYYNILCELNIYRSNVKEIYSYKEIYEKYNFNIFSSDLTNKITNEYFLDTILNSNNYLKTINYNKEKKDLLNKKNDFILNNITFNFGYNKSVDLLNLDKTNFSLDDFYTSISINTIINIFDYNFRGNISIKPKNISFSVTFNGLKNIIEETNMKEETIDSISNNFNNYRMKFFDYSQFASDYNIIESFVKNNFDNSIVSFEKKYEILQKESEISMNKYKYLLSILSLMDTKFILDNLIKE